MIVTVQENFRMQERISKNFDAIVSALAEPACAPSNLCLDHCVSIAQALSSVGAISVPMTGAIEAMAQLQLDFSQTASIRSAGIESALRAFDQIPENLRLISTFQFGQPLISSLVDTMEQIEPYFLLEDVKKCETVIEPKLQEKSVHYLSLSDIVAILSLLVSIFFGIVASMPDEQTERIIAQNEVIIEQQAEISRLKDEDQALLNTLNSLSNSINLLTDEVELLREKLEASDDPSCRCGQSHAENRQQQNRDPQD